MIFQKYESLHSSLLHGVSGHSFGTRLSIFNQSAEKANKVITMEQVHGSDIAVVENHSQERIPSVDGVVSRLPGYILTIRTADCLPLLFFDEINGVVAAAHCGWKGSYKRLSQRMVSRLISEGSRTQNIKVAIGPGIGSCCYEIFGERLEEFKSEFDYWPEFIDTSDDKQTLNLTRLNYRQLLDAGIPKKNIDFFPFCTKCDSGRFYSYNRDKTTDRMISFIML